MLNNEKKQENDCLFIVSYTVSGKSFVIFLVVYEGESYLINYDSEANISGYFCPCCIGESNRKQIVVVLNGGLNQVRGNIKWCCSSTEAKTIVSFLQMFNLFKKIPFAGFSVDDLPEELVEFSQHQVESELAKLGIKRLK